MQALMSDGVATSHYSKRWRFLLLLLVACSVSVWLVESQHGKPIPALGKVVNRDSRAVQSSEFVRARAGIEACLALQTVADPKGQQLQTRCLVWCASQLRSPTHTHCLVDKKTKKHHHLNDTSSVGE
jgi:hypothetical protein